MQLNFWSCWRRFALLTRFSLILVKAVEKRILSTLPDRTEKTSPLVSILYSGGIDRYEAHSLPWNLTWSTLLARLAGLVLSYDYPLELVNVAFPQGSSESRSLTYFYVLTQRSYDTPDRKTALLGFEELIALQPDRVVMKVFFHPLSYRSSIGGLSLWMLPPVNLRRKRIALLDWCSPETLWWILRFLRPYGSLVGTWMNNLPAIFQVLVRKHSEIWFWSTSRLRLILCSSPRTRGTNRCIGPLPE